MVKHNIIDNNKVIVSSNKIIRDIEVAVISNLFNDVLDYDNFKKIREVLKANRPDYICFFTEVYAGVETNPRELNDRISCLRFLSETAPVLLKSEYSRLGMFENLKENIISMNDQCLDAHGGYLFSDVLRDSGSFANFKIGLSNNPFIYADSKNIRNFDMVISPHSLDKIKAVTSNDLNLVSVQPSCKSGDVSIIKLVKNI